jgi:hypothetical protein
MDSTYPKKDLLDIFADDKKLIVYRPEWRKISGGLVTGAILLQQIIFHWNQQKRKPFYKFKAPCDHSLCIEGDTWIEELGFSTREFDTAMKHIGQKLSKRRLAKDPTLKNHDKPVEWWIDENHLTWFTIHEDNLKTKLAEIYDTPAPPSDTPKSPAVTPESPADRPELPCQHGQCPLNDTSAFREMTHPHLGKQHMRIQGNDTSAFSMLNDKCAFREMTNAHLDLDKDQRDLTEKRDLSEREKEKLPPSLSFYIQYFHLDLKDVGKHLSEDQQKIFVQFEDLRAWEEVCQIWKANCHNIWNITGMFDRYRKILLRDDEQPGLPRLDVPGNGNGNGNNGNGHEQQHRFPQAKHWLDSLGQEEFDSIHAILQQKYRTVYTGHSACWKQPEIRQELVNIWSETVHT